MKNKILNFFNKLFFAPISFKKKKKQNNTFLSSYIDTGSVKTERYQQMLNDYYNSQVFNYALRQANAEPSEPFKPAKKRKKTKPITKTKGVTAKGRKNAKQK